MKKGKELILLPNGEYRVLPSSGPEWYTPKPVGKERFALKIGNIMMPKEMADKRFILIVEPVDFKQREQDRDKIIENVGKKYNWSYMELELIKTQFKKGSSDKEIGLMLNRSPEAIMSRRYKMRLLHPGRGRKSYDWTEHQISTLKWFFHQGLTDKQMSEEFKASISAVKKKRKDLGLKRGGWSKSQDAYLKKMFCSGCTDEEIAVLMKRGRCAIRTRRKALNYNAKDLITEVMRLYREKNGVENK